MGTDGARRTRRKPPPVDLRRPRPIAGGQPVRGDAGHRVRHHAAAQRIRRPGRRRPLDGVPAVDAAPGCQAPPVRTRRYRDRTGSAGAEVHVQQVGVLPAAPAAAGHHGGTGPPCRGTRRWPVAGSEVHTMGRRVQPSPQRRHRVRPPRRDGHGRARGHIEPTASSVELAAARGWLDRSWASVHPWGSRRVYPNFPDPDLQDWADAYYGTNYDRLLRAKGMYDPANWFRFPQSLLSPSRHRISGTPRHTPERARAGHRR